MRAARQHLSFALAGFLASTLQAQVDYFPEETVFRQTYDTSLIGLCGRVVDQTGAPLAGCDVQLDSGESVVTGPDGTFVLTGLVRSNRLLTVTAPGFYRQILPVQLFVPLELTNVVLPPVVLWPGTPLVVRFLFGGDSAFARRMLDPLERAARDQMPIENPDALISVSDPLPGTLGVVNFVKPLFLACDYPVINFETVVTLDPSTPHWEKDYVYFTLPGSLPALKSLNIDYVGLGNNHTYDYLESGVSNTCYYLDQAGIHYSGTGSNSAAAFMPYRTEIKGMPFSFLAMTSIGGEQYATNFVASTNKGGAAYIESKAEAQAVIYGEKSAGYITIVQPHVGYEYTFAPDESALKWMRFCVDAGADLVVSHHPHVAQGFGMYRDVLLIHSLGNLFFDQVRLETMVGLVAVVDMEGRALRRAWGTPVYIEDFRPRFMCGAVRSVILRRIAEFSQQLRVFPYNGQAWLATSPDQYTFSDRRIMVDVEIGTNSWAAIDLRNSAAPDETVVRIETDRPCLTVRPGRDLMNFGDFEDVDVDGERGEASRWSFGTQTLVALRNPYRGTASLCLRRSSATDSNTVAAFRNRVRVWGDALNTPNKELSLLGSIRCQNAGNINITAQYYASEGPNEFGEELVLAIAGGTFDWQQFVQDLHMPPDDPLQPGDPLTNNARALRIFISLAPPASGVGYAWFDELAVASWEERLDAVLGPVLDSPHARDFLRVEGPAGTHQLALTFRRYRPAEADAGHGPDLALETEQPDQSVDRLWFRPTAVGFEDKLRLVVRNRGNGPLVVGPLKFIGDHVTDFSARWLTMTGVPVGMPVLTIPPRALALLEVSFAPTLPGQRQALLEVKSNDPDEDQAVVRVIVGSDAYANAPVRVISGNRTWSPSVCVQVPDIVSPAAVLQEQLPDGLMPTNITHGGQWDADSHTLTWHDVTPGMTVSYRLTGPSNVYSISGGIELTNGFEPTVGAATVLLFSSPDADEDGLPDWWEQKFFDTRTGALPDADSDNDGRSNMAEYLAGTHPLDGQFLPWHWPPYLALRLLDEQSAELQVFGFEGVTYTVEHSTALQQWSSFATNMLADQTIVIPLTALPDAGCCFFRAVMEKH